MRMTLLSDADDLPPLVRAWIAQLLSPDVRAVVEAFPDGQVDVRLSASKGKVRARPMISINSGPQNMVDPS